MNDLLKVSNLVFFNDLSKKSYQDHCHATAGSKKAHALVSHVFDAIKIDIFLPFILRHSGSVILMRPIYNAQNSLSVT